jgi:hypothetical protein
MPDVQRVDFSLPTVLDIQIRTTRFEPPRLHNFTSALSSSDEAIEFVVRTDGPMPIRALSPALYVGETPVTEVTEIGPNTYRFVALTRQGLQQGAPIRLGWSGQEPDSTVDTDFRFRL